MPTAEETNSKRKLKPLSMRSSGSSAAMPKTQITKNAHQSKLDQLVTLEENFFEEVDRDQLDRTIQQIQEERFFKREFAKDLKKFQQAGLNIDNNQQNKPKGGKSKKGDLIDSYIEGDIKLADIIVRYNNEKAGSSRNPHHN